MTPTRTAAFPRRLLVRLLALFAVVLGFQALPAPDARAAEPFKVLAFYDGTYDAAHIDFVHEANAWFPQQGAANGFTYTSTSDWGQLNTANLAKYQVVIFLDNYPHTASQQAAFKTFMDNGGGWMGFHVSAFTTDPGDWPWYHNTFLGTGAFRGNTWGPTQETLRIEDAGHAATAGLPATITSSVSEWYSWQNDLRQNPAIDILAAMDPSTFPVGTDPNQTWYSGYYPISWTNRDYRMIYNNFGHNAMNYSTNTRLSSTFASAQQNTFLLQGLRWLGGARGLEPAGRRRSAR
ncbi:ThuA domain-containing protein, partial [Streptomyces sp. DfronAA-171]|uniref:ThuA domain-containing protein n=1 Tax=Streptomyces sp. DfronAA-171 TaxID=1839777 RepID=UPI000D1B870C